MTLVFTNLFARPRLKEIIQAIINQRAILFLDFDGSVTVLDQAHLSHWDLATQKLCNPDSQLMREALIEKYLYKYFQGTLTAKESTKFIWETLIAFFWSKIPANGFAQIAKELKPRKGIGELINLFGEQNTAIVSFGMANIIQAFFELLLLPQVKVYATQVLFSQKKSTLCGIQGKIVTGQNKDEYIREFSHFKGISLKNSVVITDSLNGDKKMFFPETFNIYYEKWPERINYYAIPNLDLVICGGDFVELVQLLNQLCIQT